MKKHIEKEKTNKIYKEVKNKNLFKMYEVIVLTIITFTIGIIMGYIGGINLHKDESTKYSKDLKEFIKNYQYIVQNNIADVSDTELIKGAIEGMLSKFEDNYSYVISDDDKENFNIQLMGEYEGIGIEIVTTQDNEVYIYSVFDNSPSKEAGLEVGDLVLSVDDINAEDSSELAKYIKNSNKESFNIKIKRNDEEKTFTVKRDKIIINSVSSRVIEKDDKKIGYIYIGIFSATTSKQFKDALDKLENENIDSLIIDVRFNNGGHLTTATKILSYFLDSKNIIYQTEKDGKIEKFYSSGNETKKYPIVIIQNEQSASASEMLSSALKEQYNAKVVGKNSFGKGTVQELITLSDGTEYKFTTKKWLTPKGNWINKKGVDVDFEVELDESYYKEPTDENDSQLQKALEVLTKD